MGAGVRRQQRAGQGLRAGAGARGRERGHHRARCRGAASTAPNCALTPGVGGAGAGRGRRHHHRRRPRRRFGALAACPQVDILVTNAGGPPPGDFRDWDRDAWIKALDANMLTPIELIKATVDGMAERGFGRIVNITSAR
jgi:NAD(P)-dependent dehydrogenase (short-subunit alcohol dehydrogenase family)